MNNLFGMLYDHDTDVVDRLHEVAQSLKAMRLELAEDNKRAEEKELIKDDNVFPFGKFGILDAGSDDKMASMLAVLNGVQNNILTILRKIEDVERRLDALENNDAKQVD